MSHKHSERSLSKLLKLSLDVIQVKWDVALIQDGWLKYNCHVTRSTYADFIAKTWKSRSKKRWTRLYQPMVKKRVVRNLVSVSLYERGKRVCKLYVANSVMADHFRLVWEKEKGRSTKVVNNALRTSVEVARWTADGGRVLRKNDSQLIGTGKLRGK